MERLREELRVGGKNASKIMVQVHIYSNMLSIDLCVTREGIKYIHVLSTCSNHPCKLSTPREVKIVYHCTLIITEECSLLQNNSAWKQDDLFFFWSHILCTECA